MEEEPLADYSGAEPVAAVVEDDEWAVVDIPKTENSGPSTFVEPPMPVSEAKPVPTEVPVERPREAPRQERAVDSNSYQLHVAGLSRDTKSAGLEDFFTKVGKVIEARVIMDKFSGESKQFGFVSMADDESFKRAKTELDGAELDGVKIKVEIARGRRDDRREGGRFGGRDRSRSRGRDDYRRRSRSRSRERGYRDRDREYSKRRSPSPRRDSRSDDRYRRDDRGRYGDTERERGRYGDRDYDRRY